MNTLFILYRQCEINYYFHVVHVQYNCVVVVQNDRLHVRRVDETENNQYLGWQTKI